jgi:hypothetical protein
VANQNLDVLTSLTESFTLVNQREKNTRRFFSLFFTGSHFHGCAEIYVLCFIILIVILIGKCFWLPGTSAPSTFLKIKIIVLSSKNYENKLGHSQ